MQQRLLLIDNITSISLQPEQLNEAEQFAKSRGLGGLLIKNVILQEKDGKNQNGRVYPAEILEREVEKYQKNFITQNASYGELDHPDTPIVRLKEVSHMITEVWWDGNILKGNINILDTDNGNLVKAILRNGGRLGVSSRALGSVDRVQNESTGESYDKVKDDLEMLAWDIVSNPSVLQASFMLKEGLEKNEEVLSCRKVNEIIDLILKK